MLVAELAVDILRAAGTRAIFGVPGGGGNLDLIAAAGRAGLPFVLTSTETAGAIAAIAQAELTYGVGACLTTLGPGAASVVNGVACASLERAGLMVFTDSQPAAFEHQRLDHAALLKPIVKWSGTVPAHGAMQVMVHALDQARTGRPGPVHLDCPAGVMALEALSDPDVYFTFEHEKPRIIDQPVFERLIAQARKPLFIVGLAARGPDDGIEIWALCGRRGIPAMVTYKAKGAVADGDEWFAGVFTNAAIEQPLIEESDLLIGVGLDPVELLPRPWRNKPPIISCNRWKVEDAHVPFAAQVVAFLQEGLRLVDQAMGADRVTDWDVRRVRAHVDEQRRRVRLAGDGFTAQRVVDVAAAHFGDSRVRVTVDAGAHMLPATVLWPISEPHDMLISNGLSTMGFALPAAIGAALFDRDHPTIALTGDGGLLMCAGELLTAAREKLPILTIVFNDASLSLIEIKQQARNLPAAGVALGAVDWVRMAESVGVAGWTASTEAELDRAIGQALAFGEPALIEAKIDRSNYGATLRAVRG